jgi:c-di-GMP-binding flagellar brake protein YcgR
MIEKQQKKLEDIAIKMSEVKSSILALEEKEKINYEILEQEDDNMSFEERRKYERIPFDKPIEYSLQDMHMEKFELSTGNGVSVDISEGGLGIITDYALKKGDILFFEEEIEEEEIKVSKIAPIAAIVRWAKEIEQNKYRAGLVFRMV